MKPQIPKRKNTPQQRRLLEIPQKNKSFGTDNAATKADPAIPNATEPTV